MSSSASKRQKSVMDKHSKRGTKPISEKEEIKNSGISSENQSIPSMIGFLASFSI
jgi:hypothetical protein